MNFYLARRNKAMIKRDAAKRREATKVAVQRLASITNPARPPAPSSAPPDVITLLTTLAKLTPQAPTRTAGREPIATGFKVPLQVDADGDVVMTDADHDGDVLMGEAENDGDVGIDEPDHDGDVHMGQADCDTLYTLDLAMPSPMNYMYSSASTGLIPNVFGANYNSVWSVLDYSNGTAVAMALAAVAPDRGYCPPVVVKHVETGTSTYRLR